MISRLRLLMLATALLYLGPLLAGLAGMGWSAVPAFALVFVLWLVVMRPQQWPRRLEGWRSSAVIVQAVTQTVVQLLLVLLCFGIGRGIGGVAGLVPLVHPALPIALSFLAIPLSRLIWDPVQGVALDSILDDALRRIEEAEAEPEPEPAAANRMLVPLPLLETLAPDAPDGEAQNAVAREMALPDPEDDRMTRLLFQLDHAVRHPAARRGLILWGTDPAVVAERAGQRVVDAAFFVTFDQPDYLRLFLDRAIPLLAARPDLWDDFPRPEDLRHAAGDANPPALNADLDTLAAALEAAMPAELQPEPAA